MTALSLPAIQEQAKKQMHHSLAHGYRLDWDVREQNVERELFIEEPAVEEVPTLGQERPLVSPRSAVLLTGSHGQGKSWRLFRLGYELVEQGQLAILLPATGSVTSDLEAIADLFCREIWRSDSVLPLPDIRQLVRKELPNLAEPWLTVLIDGIKDEEYANNLLHYPWRDLGLRVALGYRVGERSTEETDRNVLPVPDFSVRELSKYLKLRSGIDWMPFPKDIAEYLKLPLFAKLFCDLGTNGTNWKGANEYYLFERVWTAQTAVAPLAAAAVAGLASRLPEDGIYPWPLAKVWSTGLRDGEIKALIDSGLLCRTSSGRRSRRSGMTASSIGRSPRGSSARFAAARSPPRP